MEKESIELKTYVDQLAVQMRKGLLTYCVLVICSKRPVYSSDIITKLREVDMVVVEGTMYPLLSRLQKDGLLSHEWKESEQGPPRKYYKITSKGDTVRDALKERTRDLQATLGKLEGEKGLI